MSMDPEEGSSAFDPRLNEVCKMLWGPNVTNDIFQRWSQGFLFSEDEPTALVQHAGGPCAVIAPMQAFILRFIIAGNQTKSIEEGDPLIILVKAATEVLRQTTGDTENFNLVRCKRKRVIGQRSASGEEVLQLEEPPPEYLDMDFFKFHENLEIVRLRSIEQVFKEYLDGAGKYLMCSYGVLLFLYSVMLTRGLEELRNDLSDPSDILIENTFGYGSQSLINLMLTGRAVSHVWDHEQDIAGLKLKGLITQSPIGFLTLLEHHQLCEVGSFFKNPKYPIWVLASDTHLSVLFSFEKSLVGNESQWDEARRIFKNYDTEGNNFIDAKFLGPLLQDLDLVSEDEYVDLMAKKLDSDSFGIILLKDFMEEFFPGETNTIPDAFQIWHYNGLAKSSTDNKVRYRQGQAVLLETSVRGVMESDMMLTVLQTKWPNIDVQWDNNITPSLN